MIHRKARSMAGFVVFTVLLQIFGVLLVLALISPEATVPFSSYTHQAVRP